MEFNPDKCQVIRFYGDREGRDYTIHDQAPWGIEEQRNFGVQVHRSPKVAAQEDKGVKAEHVMLAFKSWDTEYKNMEDKTLVRQG